MSEQIKKPKGKHGGARPGSGRPRTGQKPTRSAAAERARNLIVDSGKRLPLEWLVDNMNDPENPLWFRKECCMDALPYCHTKLSSQPVMNFINNGGQQAQQPSGELGGIERVVVTIEGDHWQGTGTPAIGGADSEAEAEDNNTGSVRSLTPAE